MIVGVSSTGGADVVVCGEVEAYVLSDVCLCSVPVGALPEQPQDDVITAAQIMQLMTFLFMPFLLCIIEFLLYPTDIG